MKKFIGLGILSLSISVFASGEDPTLGLQYIRSHNIGACNFWNYESSIRGYVCSSYPQSVTVADAYSVEDENRDLRSKNDALDARIKALEDKNP